MSKCVTFPLKAANATRPSPLSAARATQAALREDLALAQRCANDPAAERLLFDRHAPQLYRVAYRLVGDAVDAEDVLQDAFVEIFAALSDYRGEAPLSAWAHRILARTAWRFLKRASRRRRASPVIHDPPPTTDRLHGRATLRHLWGALDRMSAKRRLAFVLHHVEGYTIQETGDLMGISHTAAKKLLWRGRTDLERLARKDPLLRQCFASKGGGDAAGS